MRSVLFCFKSKILGFQLSQIGLLLLILNFIFLIFLQCSAGAEWSYYMRAYLVFLLKKLSKIGKILKIFDKLDEIKQ